jgi:hypothetical protein
VTDKDLFQIRNKIASEAALPRLKERGFNMSPFATAWNGRNNLHDYEYELCRLAENRRLEFLKIYIARGDRWIKFTLNIFEVHPEIQSIQQLKGVDGLQFRLPPNSLSEMRLRIDDVKGVPLFRLNYMNGHKLKRFRTESGMRKSVHRLTQTIEKDIADIDRFVARWHEMHRPLKTTLTGQMVAENKTKT